jgi:hypothetical protein
MKRNVQFFLILVIALTLNLLLFYYFSSESKTPQMEVVFKTVKPFTIEPDSVITPAPKTIYCYTGCYGRPEMGTIIMVNDTSVQEFKFSRVVKLK